VKLNIKKDRANSFEYIFNIDEKYIKVDAHDLRRSYTNYSRNNQKQHINMNLIKENCNHIDNDLKTWAKNVKFEPVKENIRLELNEIEGADNLKLVAFINAAELQCSNEANVSLSLSDRL